MDPVTLASLAMLGSALCHAFMGLYTKASEDTLVFRAVMMFVGGFALLPVLLTHDIPGWEVWRFLLVAAGLHWAFQMAMISAFNQADMGLVYPVMRGAAPALAAGFALLFLGEVLSWGQTAGLAIAVAAVIGFGWSAKGGMPAARPLGFALLAAGMTALYSVNDAAGARAAENPLVYLAWLYWMIALPVGLTALMRRGRRLPALARSALRPAIIAALFGMGTYSLAIYAFSLAPVGPMAALRETSVVFGAGLAAWVLKEPFGRKRILLAICLAAGLVFMQVSPGV